MERHRGNKVTRGSEGRNVAGCNGRSVPREEAPAPNIGRLLIKGQHHTTKHMGLANGQTSLGLSFPICIMEIKQYLPQRVTVRINSGTPC